MRCIVVDNNTIPDKETNVPVRVVTCYQLARKYKDGKLWHHKKDQALMTIRANASEAPDEFARLGKVLPGQLVDIALGVNEFTGKNKIASYELLEDTNVYTEEDLYI